ncbi:hypothetical protein PR202_gb11954 [Eleusine coracana subsp. coracana]|uniref:Legume lectin domain-containing protein n=1 Tax=Eleusine coracana subsp. coracana TaxID=191504 RepID=A0AAV5ELJ7_ELECO|nr:hypothetical protein QOZ80_7BG0583690 [Eleusine coracana subsp. coracana]GJN24223.1 hypothetical protein PR202_gb11954 [Eleusine coracana subsp. coracana]
MEMVTPLLFLLLLLASSAAATSSFSLDFFPGTGAATQLALSGAANATSGAVSMGYPGARVQFKDPLVFSSAGQGLGLGGGGGGGGFSTYFSFALPPAASLAFFLTPSSSSATWPPALTVVFSATHIRIDLAGRTTRSKTQFRSPSTTTRSKTRRLHSWIDYNATSGTLHVSLSAARLPNPPPALLAYPLDLRMLAMAAAVAGFQFQSSSATGNCSLFSWAFHFHFHGPHYRMHSQPLNPSDLLTTPPPPPPDHRAPDLRRYSYSRWGAAVSLLFAAACGAMVTFFVLFLWYSVSARRPVAPVEHPTEVVYEKIVLVGAKDDDAPPSGGNKNC